MRRSTSQILGGDPADTRVPGSGTKHDPYPTPGESIHHLKRLIDSLLFVIPVVPQDRFKIDRHPIAIGRAARGLIPVEGVQPHPAQHTQRSVISTLTGLDVEQPDHIRRPECVHQSRHLALGRIQFHRIGGALSEQPDLAQRATKLLLRPQGVVHELLGSLADLLHGPAGTRIHLLHTQMLNLVGPPHRVIQIQFPGRATRPARACIVPGAWQRHELCNWRILQFHDLPEPVKPEPAQPVLTQ